MSPGPDMPVPPWCYPSPVPMGRVLGIDWGEKRIGVAASDVMGWTARALALVARRGGAELDEIAALVEAEEIERIVVGMPVHDDGTPSKSAPKIEAFVEALRARLPGLPVETWDESNTSWEANRILQERGVSWKDSKKQVDQVAAEVMLQAWLEAHPRPRLSQPGESDEEETPA